jgi:hypothetical protein
MQHKKTQSTAFEKIKKDMPVYDRYDEKVGTVAEIRFGDDDPRTPEPESVQASAPQEQGSTLVEDLAQAFRAGPNLPPPLRARLDRMGYLKLAGGLFQKDTYVLPNQIAQVDEERVTLSVPGGELVHA